MSLLQRGGLRGLQLEQSAIDDEVRRAAEVVAAVEDGVGDHMLMAACKVGLALREQQSQGRDIVDEPVIDERQVSSSWRRVRRGGADGWSGKPPGRGRAVRITAYSASRPSWTRGGHGLAGVTGFRSEAGDRFDQFGPRDCWCRLAPAAGEISGTRRGDKAGRILGRQ